MKTAPRGILNTVNERFLEICAKKVSVVYMSELKAVVCLPTRNEEESVALMIQSIRDHGFELFISDSNSTDRTASIAAEYSVEVFQRENPGKASGIREALKIARKKGYDVLVYLDCDSTYPVDKIGELVKLSSKYDLVIGSRNLNDVTLIRRLVNYFHTGLINLLFDTHFKDVNSGFRVLRIDRFIDLLEAEYMDMEVELCCKAARLKIPFTEYDVAYGDRTGSSKVHAKDFFEITARIFKEYFKK